MIRRLGSFMGIILLTTILAVAQEDYALVISGSDDGRVEAECFDCYSNIVTQDDTQIIDTVKIGLNNDGSEVTGIANEGLLSSNNRLRS